MTPTITITGQTAEVQFRAFDLDAYRLFLKAKALPEKQVAYDRDTDTYRFTTHKRFAGMLGTLISERSVEELPVSPFLFDYQQFIVTRAMEAQRFAVFADTGLGKTLMELEIARQVLHRVSGKVLLMTMPKIIPQTIEEAKQFYPEMPVLHLTTREALIAWLVNGEDGVAISNYEKMIPGLIPEFRYLSALLLDEASVLKTGGGKIKWNLIKSAKGLPYKFTFTATPAPNDTQEYASQASFLEKIQGFWDFFLKKGEGKGDWYLKPHAAQAFYRFMASWSIFMRQPARFGFADNLASIPAPVFHDIEIPATQEQMDFAMGVFATAGSGLFGDKALGVVHRTKLSEAAKGFVYDHSAPHGVRHISSQKPSSVAGLVRDCIREGRQVLVWTVFDEESALIEQALRNCFVYRGETVPDHAFAVLKGGMKETAQIETLERFRHGEVRALISKPQLLGFGMNFQFCTAMIFSGWDDSYERYYQAVRRAYRYGQTEEVHIYMPVVSELEGPILENLMRKRANFEADAQAQEDAFIEVYRT